MAQWHLNEILKALEKKGWQFIRQRPGDDYRVSATWQLERSGHQILIDFDGLDDMQTLM